MFSVVFARVDNRTYTSVVDTLAIWVNPSEIKVYVENSPKAHILKKAFIIWDKSLRANLNFVFVEDENKADITIGYVEKLDKDAVGIAYPRYLPIQGKIYLFKSKILIAKKNPMGVIQSDGMLLKVTLHEIGHAIGIIGHSNSINDIMYYSTASTKNTSPSLRDIDTVNKLYGF